MEIIILIDLFWSPSQGDRQQPGGDPLDIKVPKSIEEVPFRWEFAYESLHNLIRILLKLGARIFEFWLQRIGEWWTGKIIISKSYFRSLPYIYNSKEKSDVMFKTEYC